jgi:SAM-dependent methyltransferase
MNQRMGLPDDSRLLSLSKTEWRSLGLRLAQLGIDSSYVAAINKVGMRQANCLRAPMRKWHLQRMTGLAACALRLLTFGERVRSEEARAALGNSLVTRLIDVSLIQEEGEWLFSPFYIKLVMNRLYILCDDQTHRGSAVMGVGETTGALCQAVWPLQPTGRVLDLGCGAGTVGLLLASHANQVVGTDINPRAVVFSRVNAAINGIDNIRFVEGDGFSAIAGQRFDLIVSQPPFVSLPAESNFATFMHGGLRGDELAMSWISAVPHYLGPTGRAVFLTQWPDEEGLELRIRATLNCEELNLLLVRCPAIDADDLSMLHALNEHFELGADFERMAILRRDHLERLGIRGVCTSFTVIERIIGGTHGWTAVIEMPSASTISLSSLRIDKALRKQNLLADGTEAIESATLRIPAGVVFAEEYSPDDPPKRRRIVRLPSLATAIEINIEAWKIFSLVHESVNVREAARLFAHDKNISIDEVSREVVCAVRQALRLGILEPS